MDLGIEGKRAIVCASSRGLGRACAEALAREGVEVTINGRSAETLAATADAIRDVTSVEVRAVVGDICITFVQPYGTEQWVGLLEDFMYCEYTMTYTELNSFAVAVAQADMIPVSDAEDEELQDYQEATYYWLDGPVESIE